MKEAPHHYLLKEKKLSFANNMISFCTSRTQKNTTKQNCMITDSPILFWTHLNVRHRVWMYQPSGFCSCKVKPVLVFVWFIWLRCPGFNSTVPALSHYHTEQTECVCRVVKLSSAFWQPPPHPYFPPPPISSPAGLHKSNLQTAHVHCLPERGSLCGSMSFCVCVRALMVECERKWKHWNIIWCVF